MEIIKQYKWEIILFVVFVGLFYVYPGLSHYGAGVIFSECLGTFALMFLYGVMHENEKIEWIVPLAVGVMQVISLFIVLHVFVFWLTIVVTALAFGGLFLGIAIGKNGLI